MSTDNNFTKVPNNILDALPAQDLSSTQLCTLIYIIRKTYGWSRDSASISISSIALHIHRERETVSKCIKDLEDRNILQISGESNGKPHIFKINPPQKWKPVTKKSHVTKKSQQPVMKKSQGCDEKITGTCDENVTHKRNKEITINTRKKEAPTGARDYEAEGWGFD